MDIETDIDAARARVQAQVDAAAARRRALREVSDDLRSLTATARSQSGTVEVEAGVDGRIVAVRLASVNVSPTALGDTITHTIAEAQRAARDAAADLAAGRIGADSPITQSLRPQPTEGA